jgi:hypothetical protein
MRKTSIVILALAAILLAAAGAFSALAVSIDNDLFRAPSSSAALVDRPASTVGPKNLNLSGDLLLTFDRSTGLAVRSPSAPATAPRTLLDAVSVTSVAPGGRYVVAWTGFRWDVVRLSDLRVVAEVQGAEPFFLDDHRALALFQGNGCSRRDGMILDLRGGVTGKVKLSGDKAGLSPVAIDGDEIIAERQARGDSGCVGAGVARLDLGTGSVRRVATTGRVVTVAGGRIWLGEGDAVKVVDASGLTTSFSPRVTAAALADGVVYAEAPPDRPTRLRVGAASGPRPEDRAGDQLLEPRRISVVQGGVAVVVTHRGRDLPAGGHVPAVSWCSLPELRCRVLDGVTELLAVVPAEVFKPVG